MERKIGEIFEYNGEWYQCVGGTCRNCSFYYDTVCKNITTIGSTNFGNCHCSLRTDHKSVIFKKLEKIGEPITVKGRIFQKLTSDNNSCKECVFNVPNKACCKNSYIEGICDDNGFWVEIKQNKEDMEEKKIQHYDCFFDREPSKSNSKPFDLEAAKSGKPVCTRNGQEVRIICFDAKLKNYSIVALVKEKGSTQEYLHTYTNEGRIYYKNPTHSLDLVMPLKKKTGWVNIFVNGEYTVSNIYTTEQSAKVNAIIGKAVDTIQIEWYE